jgi:hypothetical protein
MKQTTIELNCDYFGKHLLVVFEALLFFGGWVYPGFPPQAASIDTGRDRHWNGNKNIGLFVPLPVFPMFLFSCLYYYCF